MNHRGPILDIIERWRNPPVVVPIKKSWSQQAAEWCRGTIWFCFGWMLKAALKMILALIP